MKFGETPFPKSPYIKGKKYLDDLCPIALYGIPAYADSRRDKRVIGTVAWENFWKEELYKIYNGVRAGGHDIPGRFYYYMNYCHMSTINGVIRPDMIDLHLELAYMLEYCIENGINFLGPKARRRGISEATHSMVVDYGHRFSILRKNVISPGFKAGVAAGKKVYVEDFLAKFRFNSSMMPPELAIKYLTDNDDEIIAGYSIKNEQTGTFEDRGTFNTIYARTMHTNPNMFKGLYLNVVVSEEIGEHEDWFEFFSATKDALMSGSVQKGIMIAYGTGGNMNKGSKDFKRISEEAEYHNFLEFVMDAKRMYYYGGAAQSHQELPPESSLFLNYKPYQLIGVEDRKLAEENILKKRAELLKSGNMKKYNEELQNNPLNKAEIFRKSVVNNFNTEKMNRQIAEMDSLELKKYSRYKLDWVRDEHGLIKAPFQVSCRPCEPQEPDDTCVYIIDSEHPRANHKFLYVAGIDSYNIHQSKTSKSLGAMVVLIRNNTIEGALKKAPVAMIRTRPPRKEKFYEMCLQLAVYYDLVGNVQGDVRSAEICQYWKDFGGGHFLAKRPARFEAEDSTVSTDFWFSINRRTKPEMVGVLQTWVEDYINQCWFPTLIDELQNYDEVEIESDNDAADALGIALIQDISCELRPMDMSAKLEDDRFKLQDYEYDSHGNLLPIGNGSGYHDIDEDHDGFGRV